MKLIKQRGRAAMSFLADLQGAVVVVLFALGLVGAVVAVAITWVRTDLSRALLVAVAALTVSQIYLHARLWFVRRPARRNDGAAGVDVNPGAFQVQLGEVIWGSPHSQVPDNEPIPIVRLELIMTNT